MVCAGVLWRRGDGGMGAVRKWSMATRGEEPKCLWLRRQFNCSYIRFHAMLAIAFYPQISSPPITSMTLSSNEWSLYYKTLLPSFLVVYVV